MSDAILSDELNNSTALPIPPLDPIFLSAGDEDVSDLHFTFDDDDFDLTFDDFYFPSENEQFSIPNHSDSPESVISHNDVSKYLNSSPSHNPNSPVSSQGSGNGGSDSVDQMVVKLEHEGNNNQIKTGTVSKRKKENTCSSISSHEDDTRNHKYTRSESATAVTDEDVKRKARLMRNRESAQLSRQRKKHYVDELEDKVKAMHSTITDLNAKISFFMAENASLRQQLNSGNTAMCPPPMYPPPMHMPYPWLPCPPYVVKSQGSQVPLVPIPRLKPQPPASAPKTKVKTKKVASVTLFGLLFFLLMFGGLVPFVNVNFGGSGSVGHTFYNQHRGRVLQVAGHSNGSQEHVGVGFSSGNYDKGYRIQCMSGKDGCLVHDSEKKGGLEHLSDSDELVRFGNSSKPLVASLYVPRNDKLVKIDGNLIIHSVLASERAKSSAEDLKLNKSKETGLAIPRDFSPTPTIPGRYSHLYGHHNERQKALTSGSSDTSKDQIKSSTTDGKLQQWFHEGLAGPMLSSGMCSEVFQFDVSPTPGAIIPASSIPNITTERQQNSTNHYKGKNRRTLHGLPIPLRGSNLNITGEHVGSSQKDNYQGNKSVSPMVVSVLVDPREASDIEVDGMITPKSISRIFVVVLLDSVKYVTYSCALPRTGPHLVTA